MSVNGYYFIEGGYTMQVIDQLLKEYNLIHKKEDLMKIAALSIGIVKELTNEVDIPIGQSKFGGLPDLPSHFSFPTYHNGYLSFLAQLNLLEAKLFDGENLLPNTGILYFFYDVVNQPWGFDKDDNGCFKVFYFDGDVKELTRTAYPEETEDYFPLPVYKATFDKFISFPSEISGIELDEEELDRYFEFRDSIMQRKESVENDEGLPAYPMHYMFGEPFTIQNNVFEDVIYYDNKEKIDWDSKEIKQKRNEMVLLFQMDSDDELGVMWGDVGILYFCIDKHDLHDKQFDQTKFTLQCY